MNTPEELLENHLNELKNKAESGNIEAQFLYGSELLSYDDSTALIWLENAANAGHLEAMMLCADLCKEDGSVNALSQALHWYLKVLKQDVGNSEAAFCCGEIYRMDGPLQDLAQAHKYYMRSHLPLHVTRDPREPEIRDLLALQYCAFMFQTGTGVKAKPDAAQFCLDEKEKAKAKIYDTFWEDLDIT